jgi:hypothetical protein
MTCDWLLKWVEFDYHGTQVKLQGILPPDNTVVSQISGEQLHKLAKGNDIWALVTVIYNSQDSVRKEQYLANGIPPETQQVIYEYSNLFETPDSLPPHRDFDHAIFLYPSSVPVNCKPYRYSP